MSPSSRTLRHVLSSLVRLAVTGLFVMDGAAAETARQGPTPIPSPLTREQESTAAKDTGSEFKDCDGPCPVMVVIPPGKFSMGSPDDELDRTAGEGPRHAVTIPYAFAVSRSEITFDQWDACVAAKACPPAKDSWGRGTMPAVDISWDGAKAYVAWLSQLTGTDYRLPSEAEWEYAARAGTDTRYAWGDAPGNGHANCNGCGSAWVLQTAPVGSFEPNAFGLLDMEGNVWEWVEDVWHARFEGAPVDGSAWIEGGDATFRTIRGGSWHNEPELIRSAVRFERHRKVQFDTLGLRVARSIGR